MDLGQAVKAIQRRWLDTWPTRQPTVRFSLDNVARADADFFARLAVKHTGSEQWTMGPERRRKFQRTGLIDVRLSGPINQGRGRIDELAQTVIDVFEGRRFGVKAGEHGVVTHASTINELVRDRQAPQTWILGVVTPFEYYEIR